LPCLHFLASPNPAVGAVVVKEDAVVGQGYTQPPGSSHAEVLALKQAGAEAAGGAMYVTLEPCCHYGRTSPCSKAVVAAGVAEVHIAMLDPNPLVSGRGKRELEEAGIEIFMGEHEAEAKQINEAYTKFITTGMPFVTAKFAMSLDGKIATRSGDSRWISGEESRKFVHTIRYTSDAVMTGVNTVLADDPHLTARCGISGGTSRRQPLRVVVDGKGRTPVTARLFAEPGRTLLAMDKSAAPEKKEVFARVGAEVLELPATEGMVDTEKLMRALGGREITSVLEVIAFIAPVIVGGKEARTAVAGDGVYKMAEALKLENVKVDKLGEDVVVSGYVAKKG